MVSCGPSSRYGSSLPLKKADFSIQDDVFIRKSGFLPEARKPPSPVREGVLTDGLLGGLLERPQHGIAAGYRRVERFLGRLLACECGLHFLRPDVAHLHHCLLYTSDAA